MKFLVAIHHPDNYDGSKEDDQMHQDIDDLNDEMQAAGVRILAMGLQPPIKSKSLRVQPDGSVVVSEGAYLPGNEHIGGFWILDTADMDEAVEWGRKAVIACRAPVEVRPFH